MSLDRRNIDTLVAEAKVAIADYRWMSDSRHSVSEGSYRTRSNSYVTDVPVLHLKNAPTDNDRYRKADTQVGLTISRNPLPA